MIPVAVQAFEVQQPVTAHQRSTPESGLAGWATESPAMLPNVGRDGSPRPARNIESTE
jgi:hypothetical protein